MSAKYKRILIKLSGEALNQGNENGNGAVKIYNIDLMKNICEKIKECVDMGVEVSLVVGAGNIWRGKQGTDFERVRADNMGMLATTINALALQETLLHLGVDARVMTAVKMEAFAETYVHDKAVSHLNKGRVVIFGCGTGSPYFSTDTTAVLRAREIDADITLFAKNIDAVYTADPKKDPNAKRLESVSYIDILDKNLGVMDSTAASFANENDMKILVFGLNDPENIIRAVNGENIGTTLYSKK